MNFIVLSSSRGTTFQAIIDRLADKSLTATCLGLISDRDDRGCATKAKAANLPVKVVQWEEEMIPETYEQRLQETILSMTPPSPFDSAQDDTVLACIGWMHIFSPWFIAQWRGKMLNVHPALLPKYGGKGMYGKKVHEAVLNANEKESGMTIHLMNEEIDTGKILLQKKCPVLQDDTPEALKARVQELEKEWYPRVLEMIQEGEIVL